jgi:hypothetical protein
MLYREDVGAEALPTESGWAGMAKKSLFYKNWHFFHQIA